MSTTRPEPLRPQGGFSIVAAIFILVVLAGLAGFIVSTSNTQHLAQALEVMNSRAQQAARTGIEWGLYQVVRVPGGAYATACNTGAAYPFPGAAAASSQDLSALPGLADFTVTVACDSSSFQEGGDPAYRVYQLTATACNAAPCPATTPGAGYVEHRQRARVKMP